MMFTSHSNTMSNVDNQRNNNKKINIDTLKIELNYTSKIRTKYIRNYKSHNAKNIRCFPSCPENGHILSGFCGLPLLLSSTFSIDTNDYQNFNCNCVKINNPSCICNEFNKIIDQLQIIGEFQYDGSNYSPIEDKISDSTILQGLMLKSPLYFKAKILDKRMLLDGNIMKYFFSIEFNEKRWHYSKIFDEKFKSDIDSDNKKKNKITEHKFVTSILIPGSSSSIKLNENYSNISSSALILLKQLPTNTFEISFERKWLPPLSKSITLNKIEKNTVNEQSQNNNNEKTETGIEEDSTSNLTKISTSTHFSPSNITEVLTPYSTTSELSYYSPNNLIYINSAPNSFPNFYHPSNIQPPSESSTPRLINLSNQNPKNIDIFEKKINEVPTSQIILSNPNISLPNEFKDHLQNENKRLVELFSKRTFAEVNSSNSLNDEPLQKKINANNNIIYLNSSTLQQQQQLQQQLQQQQLLLKQQHQQIQLQQQQIQLQQQQLLNSCFPVNKSNSLEDEDIIYLPQNPSFYDNRPILNSDKNELGVFAFLSNKHLPNDTMSTVHINKFNQESSIQNNNNLPQNFSQEASNTLFVKNCNNNSILSIPPMSYSLMTNPLFENENNLLPSYALIDNANMEFIDKVLELTKND